MKFWDWLILLFLLAFVFVGAAFLFFPSEFLAFWNPLGKTLGMKELAEEAPPFWRIFSVAYMVMVCAAAVGVLLKKGEEKRPFLYLLLLGKGSSSLGGLLAFLFYPAFLFLATFLADGVVFLFFVTYLVWGVKHDKS